MSSSPAKKLYVIWWSFLFVTTIMFSLVACGGEPTATTEAGTPITTTSTPAEFLTLEVEVVDGKH